jgi:two-component system CheB/CheR fusion protein
MGMGQDKGEPHGEVVQESRMSTDPTSNRSAPPTGSPDPPGTGEPDETEFFVVGIGASAGGLEAVSALLRRTTVDGAAFIVVQHLAPNQSSMLTELLGRASRLAVETVEDGVVIEPNHVYVCPPNAVLALEGTTIRLLAPAFGARPEMPIDAFFRSLADNRGIKAMGVVMSGTGTDGTFGLAAVKAAGGITFVQEPTTAKFDGMPRSARDSGTADFCLAPEAIADEILRISSHPYLHRSIEAPQIREHLGSLGVLLKGRFGIDLAHYKPNTIERRIQRRMAVHRIERIDHYVRLCQADPNELSDLHKDLLINVTCFFRDKEPFDVLKNDILPRVLAGKKGTDVLRIWVPGCSSGEEAYSIAMSVIELLDEKGLNLRFQIFGTDLDADAVQQARRGVYPHNIVSDVSTDRLRRFFIKSEDGHYQVIRRVRDMVVFSIQNISRDPPFSKLDLISCRNLLMYLQSGIQKKVLRILHYSLNPAGFLMLGHSESVGDAADLFALIDRNNKIYTAKHVSLPKSVDFAPRTSVLAAATHERATFAAVRPVLSLAHLADRKILEQYAPPGVVINETLDIVYFRGHSDRYLQQPSGVATHNILRLARPELHATLKTAIERVFATNELVTAAPQVKTDGVGLQPFTLIVQPIVEPETNARCVLVLFKDGVDGQAIPTPVTPPAATSGSSNEAAQALSQELALTKEYLQSTIEEIERTNEDLQSANEELQSSNEELQSSNEELETSQEELQSTNEELVTLNEELQSRMKELGASNDDLHNLLLGVDRAIVIVGLDLRIRRFTQAAEKLLNMLPTDIGRSAAQLNSFLGGFGVESVIADAIKDVATVDRELLATDGRWYALRIVPYRTLDLMIRGAVISVIDIDLSKRRTDLSAAVGAYAAEGLAAIQHPLMILDGNHAVIWVNDLYFEAFQLTPQEIIGTRLGKIGNGAWSDPALERRIDETIQTGAPFRGHAVTVELEGIGETRVSISGSRLRSLANETTLVLLAIERGKLERSTEARHGN